MPILTALFFTLAAAFACEAQVVYSVGVYSMGRTYEHDWTFGRGSLRFGVVQYRQYQDASGRVPLWACQISQLNIASAAASPA